MPCSPEGSQHSGREDGVAVVDVEVVPRALGGEVLELEVHGGVDRPLQQPRALSVQRVVAHTVCDEALCTVQSGKRKLMY